QPAGPYFLGGWSMGGVVAYEMARQLEAQGERVALLAMLDSHLPDAPQTQRPDEEVLLVGFARDLGIQVNGFSLDRLAPELRDLDPEQRLNRLLEEARQARLLPPDMDLPRLRRSFQVFQRNVEAMLSYQPPSPVATRIALFRAGAPSVPAPSPRSADLGWAPWTRGGLEVIEVPADHHAIVRLPHVEQVAGHLGALAAQSSRESF
ncbi:MAG TPA: thioesterase domain-containing protein, partial [Thermoanaerobaculia bacterium]|nr:thioesterase domain-containing protein [Thermoanaerobaculia bacterium]